MTPCFCELGLIVNIDSVCMNEIIIFINLSLPSEGTPARISFSIALPS